MLHRFVIILGLLAVILSVNASDGKASQKNYKFYQVMQADVKGKARWKLFKVIITKFKATVVPSSKDKYTFKVGPQEQSEVEKYLREKGFPFKTVSNPNMKAYEILHYRIPQDLDVLGKKYKVEFLPARKDDFLFVVGPQEQVDVEKYLRKKNITFTIRG